MLLAKRFTAYDVIVSKLFGDFDINIYNFIYWFFVFSFLWALHMVIVLLLGIEQM